MATKKKTKRASGRGERSHTRTVGYGYVGRWSGKKVCDSSGPLGWCLPQFLSGHGRRSPEPLRPTYVASPPADAAPINVGKPMYLCRITVELVTDKRGRPIVRKVKP